MPDPAKLLHTLARAAAAFRATPGRAGRVVALADAADVLVGGDLHGHLGNFQALMKQADLANHPRRHLVLQEVVHGPFRYPDGGDKSHQLLDLVAALTCQFPGRVHFLPGNHELAQATGRPVQKGDDDYNALFFRGVAAAYGDRADDVYAAYLDLIAAAPLAVRTANRVFVSHSLPSALRAANFHYEDLLRDTRPEDLESDGAVYALVWGRDTRPANVAAFLQEVDADLLVSGHVPCDAGFVAPNDRQLILDSMGSPAGYCLFPADRPLTHAELVQCAGLL
jgi:Calcineurin-like phosphoesterase